MEFHNNIYVYYEKQLYIFDSNWDSFRPITRVGWNGSYFEIVDSEYKSDLYSPTYGFGDLKETCKKLNQEIELGDAKLIEDPIQFWRYCCEPDVKWWNDRPVVFANDETNRDKQSWKDYLKYIQKRAKTLRKPFKGRMTRRLVHK
jgi:hypothetical protein